MAEIINIDDHRPALLLVDPITGDAHIWLLVTLEGLATGRLKLSDAGNVDTDGACLASALLEALGYA